MSTERKGASFNPDEASGGFDKGRATIVKAVVDYFTAKSGKSAGQRYVNLNLEFARAEGGESLPVSFLIGNDQEWAPNGTKTEAIPTREDGKFWNKSDVYRFMVSLVNAGFPKNRMGSDFSVLVGLDVDLERVQTGGSRPDKDGKDRPNTALLVTKIHTSQADLVSGAYSKNVSAAGAAKGVKTSSKPSTAVKTTAAAPPSGDLSDYAKGLLVDILTEKGGSFAKADIHKPAYIAITKAKRGAERNDIIAILQNQEFIDGLVGDGLIVDDGETLAVAA